MLDFEDVVTPAGTFQNCAKVELKLTVIAAGGLINIDPTTSYQWLAPNVGPVKFEADNGDVFEVISFKLFPPPSARGAKIVPCGNCHLMSFKLRVRVSVEYSMPRILENVEDYASEVRNLGIVAVTVRNCFAWAMALVFQQTCKAKQDLWAAGIYRECAYHSEQ